MVFQIEFLINEFSKETNQSITNLINHEYSKISFKKKINSSYSCKIFKKYYYYDKKIWVVKSQYHIIIPINY